MYLHSFIAKSTSRLNLKRRQKMTRVLIHSAHNIKMGDRADCNGLMTKDIDSIFVDRYR